MTIAIRPVTSKADIISWIRLDSAAVGKAQPYLWNRLPSEASIQSIAELQYAQLGTTDCQIVKAVDTKQSNNILGFAKWSFPKDPEEGPLTSTSKAPPIASQTHSKHLRSVLC